MPYNPRGAYDVSRVQAALGFKTEYDIDRTVKSKEELELFGTAAHLGDLMLETCRDTPRPGVRESEVYGRMMEVMLANGGEEPTLFLRACDRHPYPHPFRVPTTRKIERGDLIICEIHPKTGGYPRDCQVCYLCEDDCPTGSIGLSHDVTNSRRFSTYDEYGIDLGVGFGANRPR